MQSARLQSFPPICVFNITCMPTVKFHLKNGSYAAKSKQKLAPSISITFCQIAKQTH